MIQIEDLNEDVLREIFSYLNIYDRHRIGLVCKKWQNIHQIMLRSIRKMICDVCYDSIGHRMMGIVHDRLIINTDDPSYLVKPLKKFASILQKIEINHETWNDIPAYVFRLFTRLTTLKYARLESRYYQTIKRFLKFLPTDNIEILSIEVCGYRELDHCQPELNNLFSEVLSKMRRLKFLNIYNVPVTELGSIGEIKTLKSLYLETNVSLSLNFNSFKLQNFELISIACMELDTAGIKKLIERCKKLHSIHIYSEAILSEDIINAIASLPNLRRLSLSIESITDESWNKFSNLEDIQLDSMQPCSFTRAQIIRFLQHSKNLKKFSFSHMNSEFDNMFTQVASDIGHHFDEPREKGWIYLPKLEFKI